ncbi:unnamed protein product [Pedinophyceae sp. YPF-701]|nr:unnamed protein product [Pedinophyceae sp. YPF-701]
MHETGHLVAVDGDTTQAIRHGRPIYVAAVVPHGRSRSAAAGSFQQKRGKGPRGTGRIIPVGVVSMPVTFAAPRAAPAVHAALLGARPRPVRDVSRLRRDRLAASSRDDVGDIESLIDSLVTKQQRPASPSTEGGDNAPPGGNAAVPSSPDSREQAGRAGADESGGASLSGTGAGRRPGARRSLRSRSRQGAVGVKTGMSRADRQRFIDEQAQAELSRPEVAQTLQELERARAAREQAEIDAARREKQRREAEAKGANKAPMGPPPPPGFSAAAPPAAAPPEVADSPRQDTGAPAHEVEVLHGGAAARPRPSQESPEARELRRRAVAVLEMLQAGAEVEGCIAKHREIIDERMMAVVEKRLETAEKLAAEGKAGEGDTGANALRLLKRRLQRELDRKESTPAMRLLDDCLATLAAEGDADGGELDPAARSTRRAACQERLRAAFNAGVPSEPIDIFNAASVFAEGVDLTGAAAPLPDVYEAEFVDPRDFLRESKALLDQVEKMYEAEREAVRRFKEEAEKEGRLRDTYAVEAMDTALEERSAVIAQLVDVRSLAAELADE